MRVLIMVRTSFLSFCNATKSTKLMVHIGKKIQEKLKEQGRTVVWFAQAINCDRTNAYDIFSRQSIDTELLVIISKALSFNFFIYYMDEV